MNVSAPLPRPQPKNVVYIDNDIDQRSGESTPPALPAVNAEAKDYYGTQKVYSRARTLSSAGTTSSSKMRPKWSDGEMIQRNRRLSHDEMPSAGAPRRFLVDVEETMRIVLAQEDTDHNCQISVHDSGPKLISLGTASSNAYRHWDVRGNYMLSNLLQELALARDYGRRFIVIDEARLAENPLDRLSRMIKNSFWNALTRRMDPQGVEAACNDPKNRSRSNVSRIYVPHGESEILAYYQKMWENRGLPVLTLSSDDKPALRLEVIELPPKCDDPEYVKSLNDYPGILALAMNKVDGKLEPVPFVVPGARFNEMYNWDSVSKEGKVMCWGQYFMALALLVDGRMDLAMGIIENFMFQIKHYNKILNGTRSYYLCRSQPPFFTDLALQIFNQLDRSKMEENKVWLRRAIRAAIKEYHSYWMQEPSLDTVSGLSRYRPKGQGIPPETEASHFTHILQPYAAKNRISVNDFIEAYNDGTIKEPELDEYFLHDRGVRESGHDTSYRLDGKCADLATVDLNSLLYKYEVDIASAIDCLFDDELELEDEFELSPWPITPENFAPGRKRELSTARKMTSAEWYDRARTRKATMDELLWNEGQSMYFDYNTKKRKQARYESVTTLWPLWAGCASEEQALRIVHNSLSKFEVAGGVVSGTETSRGAISLDRPNRQWDFPFGWSPHQIMAWVGLERYGFLEDAARLAYRWMYMVVMSFSDFNGLVPEKFDIVGLSHMVDAEYGQQGIDFKHLPREGFGWCNASVQLGLQCLTTGMRRAIAVLTPPWDYFDLPVPDLPAIRRREDRIKMQEEGRKREAERRPSAVHRSTFETTIEGLKNVQL